MNLWNWENKYKQRKASYQVTYNFLTYGGRITFTHHYFFTQVLGMFFEEDYSQQAIPSQLEIEATEYIS